MKILIEACGCTSRGGSEGYFGWSAVQCLAKDHELWVLTSSRCQSDLEQAQFEGLVPKNVRFIFLGGPFKWWHENRWLSRFQDWKEYYDFSARSLVVAKRLHREVGFDLAHHVTIATWRVGSPLWKLSIPFIFGPIGGSERFPFRFFPALSLKAMAFELLRKFSNLTSAVSPSVRACIRNAAHVFAANSETLSLMKTLRRSDVGVSLLIPGFYSRKSTSEFSQHASLRTLDGPLRLFAGGNLEGRKGVALALHALAHVKAQGVRFRYRLGGRGPEFDYLQELTHRLNLSEEVILGEGLSGEAYRKELGATHIFLLPSLRESAGLTMMEAMLAGCVPIVANCGGPAHIVTDECGYRIPVTRRDAFIDELANIIITLDHNRETIGKKGRAAAERIATYFTDETYRKAVNDVYVAAINA
jgi:glycosyltransferase involved in cell wall biosynthesis